MNEQNNSSDHLVLGGLLFLVFSLVVALVFVYTRAGTVTTSGVATTTAEVDNTAPVVDSVNVAYTDEAAHIGTSTGLDLAVGTTKQVVIWGTVSDQNGEGDIDNLSMSFYRTGLSNDGITTLDQTCTADNNECYRADLSDTCTFAADTATSKKYACTIAMEFWADGTKDDGGAYPAESWVAHVAVTDLASDSTSATNQTEVNGLLALEIPEAIDYSAGGAFALGDSTTDLNNNEMVLNQRGNVHADVEVSGVDMGCSVLGSIPTGNQEWALTDVAQGNASSNTLTGSAVDTDVNVNYRTAEAAEESKTLYWNILIPSTGVSGVCTGSNTLSIKVHEVI